MRLKVTHMLIGACIAAAAGSCSNDQIIDDLRPAGGNDSEGISFVVADDYTRGGSFGNRPGLSTRASVTTTDNIEQKPFAVYGDMTSIDPSSNVKNLVLFNGDEVKHDGSLWAYTNPRYWFTDYEYSFVALYPKTFNGLDSANISYEDNTLTFNYTLPDNYADATDILIAGHRRLASTTNKDKKVYLSFAHIMTRLDFVAKVESTSEDHGIEITNITIKGVASEGTYTALPGTYSNDAGTYDFDEARWSTEGSARIDLSKNPGTKIETSRKDNMSSISLFPQTDPLFIIPQEVTEDLVVLITYTRNGKSEDPIEGRLDSAMLGQWLPGLSYTYSFTIKEDNEAIIFDAPTVQDWIDYEGGQYIIQ